MENDLIKKIVGILSIMLGGLMIFNDSFFYYLHEEYTYMEVFKMNIFDMILAYVFILVGLMLLNTMTNYKK